MYRRRTEDRIIYTLSLRQYSINDVANYIGGAYNIYIYILKKKKKKKTA
jgi:hypothetical protein